LVNLFRKAMEDAFARTSAITNSQGLGSVNLAHLRLTIAAADHGSFRRAAESLAIRQSTLSRTIRQFEQSIGITLFERSSGGVAPTPAAHHIIRMARTILDDFDALVASGKSNQGRSVDRLAIGFCSSLSVGNLRAMVSLFKEKFPKTELVTAENSRMLLSRMLRRGNLDILIVTPNDLLRGYRFLPLWSERVLVALPSAHRLAERENLHWTDLSGEIVLVSRHDPGPEIEDLLKAKFISSVERPKIERHDVGRGALKALVSMGFGISLVLESDLGAALPSPLYRELRDGTGASRLDFSAFWRADSENPALDSFLELLRERYPSPASVSLRR
jgi:DNA-binding transcriptional LysR family regulator